MANAENKLLVVMRTHPDTSEPLLKSTDLEKLEDIHRYIKCFTYLRESDSKFWSKLIYELPRKSMT